MLSSFSRSVFIAEHTNFSCSILIPGTLKRAGLVNGLHMNAAVGQTEEDEVQTAIPACCGDCLASVEGCAG